MLCNPHVHRVHSWTASRDSEGAGTIVNRLPVRARATGNR